MCEATGGRPNNTLLAEVIFPSVDESCLRELEDYQVEYRDLLSKEIRKRPIDVGSYTDLREYVWKRQARERTLVPVPAVKMDISTVGVGDTSGYNGSANGNGADDWGSSGTWTACMPCNDKDSDLIPSPWHD